MRTLIVGLTVAGLLATHEVGAVKPLDNTQEFLFGPFRMPQAPPSEGPVPPRLQGLPRDTCALPEGTWLRFQNFGAERYKDWSAQMQIDDQGNLYLVTHLGDATPEKVKHPAWPDKPTQKLDATTLADLRKAATTFAAGAPYRGHAGLSYAPTFVLTIKLDTMDKEIVLEGYENDFVAHLRRITEFAHKTPLKPDKPKAKPKSAAKPKTSTKPPAHKP